MVETELDFDTLVGRGEETKSVEGKLELGADTDEDASLGFDAILPAELQSQDVFVFIRLQRENKKWQVIKCRKCVTQVCASCKII